MTWAAAAEAVALEGSSRRASSSASPTIASTATGGAPPAPSTAVGVVRYLGWETGRAVAQAVCASSRGAEPWSVAGPRLGAVVSPVSSVTPLVIRTSAVTGASCVVAGSKKSSSLLAHFPVRNGLDQLLPVPWWLSGCDELLIGVFEAQQDGFVRL